jgi:hypothetical protein
MRSGPWIIALTVALGACGDAPPPKPDATKAAIDDPKPELTGPELEAQRVAHRVVFADRTSHSYLLLTPGPLRPEAVTRDGLAALVKKRFPENQDDQEVQLLIELIATEPLVPQVPTAPDDPGTLTPLSDTNKDLLGLHIEAIEIDAGVLPPAALEDDILLRDLQPEHRIGLAQRGWAILLRADYRNQHGVRGLRLLQTLARLVADERKAVIHDPDTLETMSPEAFSRRRLQSSLGNVSDQLAVVPFEDPRHRGHLRLTTRGMRRFGAVDLELDGLARDEWSLQRGTDLLYGLALVMLKEGEFDESGFAVQVSETVGVQWRDASQAYAGRDGKLPRCDDCPQSLDVHLVERPREDRDPHGHVVARVVAPRTQSDGPDYDHPRWVSSALRDVFGDPATE